MGLVLTRKEGERILVLNEAGLVIGGIEVHDCRAGKCRVDLSFDRNKYRILRAEVYCIETSSPGAFDECRKAVDAERMDRLVGNE